ncbi:MAG: 4-(cytidine 5'-diphospho)-2-C-methyl-D-erythritol kinase [Micrococcales bacterium]
MHFDVSKSRSGWSIATANRYYTVDLPRLYAILDDPDSWPVAVPLRRLTVEPNKRLGYAFENQSRVELSLAPAKTGVQVLTIRHENLKSQEELDWAVDYWTQVCDSLATRTLSEPVTGATAYGKINLYFAVGPLRADGYHDVASLYQAVTLVETVIVEPNDEWQVETTGSLDPLILGQVPTGKSNLVVKAAQAVAKLSKVRKAQPLKFFVTKHVPVAGGMGGGSADCAAALLAANQFYGNKLDRNQLFELASELGADVPFSLMGGAALGIGTGHELTPVSQTSELHWVLIPNPFGLSTPLVFAELDRLRAERGIDPTSAKPAKNPAALLRALKTGASAQEIAPLIHNDLQEAAVSLRPELAAILELGLKCDALAAVVSGSGPTIALLARNNDDAAAIASRMRTFGYQAIQVASPTGPARLID